LGTFSNVLVFNKTTVCLFIFNQAKNTNKGYHRVLRKAVEVIKDNVELWINLISYYLSSDSLEMGIEAFQAGVRALTSKSLPLWQILILYLGNTHPKLVK